MKRTLICVFLMLAMIVTGVILDMMTLDISGELTDGLNELEAGADTFSSDELRDKAKKLSEKWESFCGDNIFLTNNEGAFEVSGALVRIISYAESDRQRFAEECRTAAQLVELYNESRSITFGNIF